jgi:hypothetical protein
LIFNVISQKILLPFITTAVRTLNPSYTFIIYNPERSRSQVSSVGIVPGYGLDSQGSIPCRSKRYSLFLESGPALGPIQPPL